MEFLPRGVDPLARAAAPRTVEAQDQPGGEGMAAGQFGDQAGGRVFLFLRTADFWRDYRDMQARGVQFTEEPREETFGTVAVFLDLYGNRWDLVQPMPA